MNDVFSIVVKSGDFSSNVLTLVTEINKTSNLTALVLPDLDKNGFWQIKIETLPNISNK